MKLVDATWPEVDDYLAEKDGILLPVGSTEQHGPMGLIGTDAICAEAIAARAAEIGKAYVAPVLAYTPAPFNTNFPGTISLSEPVFEQVFAEVIEGLHAQGFGHIYVLNAHGANLAPMGRAATASTVPICIKSWWDFAPVNAMREAYYGDWEGLHATPSEVSITQALGRRIPPGLATEPPRRLSAEERAARAGDRHGPPELHRAEFPDGRVGAHSALARPEHGEKLLRAAADAVAADFLDFVSATT